MTVIVHISYISTNRCMTNVYTGKAEILLTFCIRKRQQVEKETLEDVTSPVCCVFILSSPKQITSSVLSPFLVSFVSSQFQKDVMCCTLLLDGSILQETQMVPFKDFMISKF